MQNASSMEGEYHFVRKTIVSHIAFGLIYII